MSSDNIVLETEYLINAEKAADFPNRLEKHIDEILGLPGFISADVYAAPETGPNSPFVVKYLLSDQAALDTYFAEHSESQNEAFAEVYGDKLKIESRVLANKFSRSDDSCSNCGLAANFQYCANCGQRHEDRVLSIWSLIAELFGGLFNWDSRVWRTLRPLIARPGFLTNEYLNGKRVHYTPPLRMYLVLSILFFLTNNILFKPTIEVEDDTHGLTIGLTQDETPAKVENTKVANDGAPLEGDGIHLTVKPDEDLDINCNWQGGSAKIPFMSQSETRDLIRDACLRLTTEQGREVFLSKLFDRMPLLLLFLLPLLAFASKLFYPFSKRYYVEHLLFFIHYHAYLFCVLLIIGLLRLLLGFLGLGNLTWVLYSAALIYSFYYFYRMLRECFRSERRSALLRLPLYGFVYLTFTSIVFTLGVFSAAIL